MRSQLKLTTRLRTSLRKQAADAGIENIGREDVAGHSWRTISLSSLARALVLALLFGSISACDETAPVDNDDVHDFSQVDGNQNLVIEVKGEVITDKHPFCFESKADVCRGVRSPKKNSNCFSHRLAGPPCNRYCLRFRHPAGKTYGKAPNKRSDKCCVRENDDDGDFLPIWSKEEDDDCPAIGELEKEFNKEIKPKTIFAEDRQCNLLPKSKLCEGLLDGLPDNQKACYTKHLMGSGSGCDVKCFRKRRFPFAKIAKWSSRPGTVENRILASDGRQKTQMRNGLTEYRVYVEDGCCIRDNEGKILKRKLRKGEKEEDIEIDPDCIREEAEKAAQLAKEEAEKAAQLAKEEAEKAAQQNEASNPPPSGPCITSANTGTTCGSGTPNTPAPSKPSLTAAEMVKLDAYYDEHCTADSDDSTNASAWPVAWVTKEKAILDKLNKTRQNFTHCQLSANTGCRAEKASTAPDPLVTNSKLRVAARCHALTQAKKRCFSHYPDGIEEKVTNDNGEKVFPWVDRVNRTGYISADYKAYTDETRTFYLKTGNPSEIMRSWSALNKTKVEEMDFIMNGFMTSYAHCLPIMNRAQNGPGCEKTVKAPYREVGVAVVDVSQIDLDQKGFNACLYNTEEDKETRKGDHNYLSPYNYLSVINFGVPGN